MSRSTELLTVQEIADYFGVSTQTIRRRIKAAKSKKSSFPSPVFGYGKKALYRRSEVVGWKETVEPGQSGKDE
jgi:excisionase family DNA binding protein